MSFSRDGRKVPGYSGAVAPTLENIVEKLMPSESQANGSLIEQKGDGDTQQARTEDGELYGAPADASKSPHEDNEVPHERSGVVEASDQEQATPRACANLRKTLAGSGGTAWTLPTPTPKVDPQGFEDPISDAFWKNVWVACAVHNVSIYNTMSWVNLHFYL
jgi:phospholipase D1/2